MFNVNKTSRHTHTHFTSIKVAVEWGIIAININININTLLQDKRVSAQGTQSSTFLVKKIQIHCNTHLNIKFPLELKLLLHSMGAIKKTKNKIPKLMLPFRYVLIKISLF